jgi:formate/nitrite transporter FocA (FNT family)
MHSARLSIWFFIGVLLFIYGLLILGYGISTLVTGNLPHVALANLHAPVWWGALMTALGVFYLLKFRPGTARK